MADNTRPVADEAPAIEARGVIKRYGDVTALGGVDLAVPRAPCWACWAPTGRARRR
ncbi:MAG: hypothetical protein R2704_04375 [Microthrixaceae bacterium]